MNLQRRINAFINGRIHRENPLPDELLKKQLSKNPSLPQKVNRAYQNWANLLQESTLQKWIAPYQLIPVISKRNSGYRCGEYPIGRFHDFLCV
jgi:hypothetical protein